MNFVCLLFVTLLFFSFLDFFPQQWKFKKQMYYISFAVAFFVVAIKYYFGPDIVMYHQIYIDVESPIHIILHGTTIKNTEIGYVFFCSILKCIGFSLWGISLVITILYFYSIHLLFKNLQRYRIFALFLLVLLDYNLLFYEFRQCLAVSFFIFSFLAFKKKKYFYYFLFSVITVLTHKSSAFVCLFMFIALNMKYVKVTKKEYWMLLFLLIMFLFVSIETIFNQFFAFLPLKEETVASISYHLSQGKKFQTIFIIYAITIACVAYYIKFKDLDFHWNWLILSAFILIVLFYQEWFLLNRIRSYVLPFILVYCTNNIGVSTKKPIVYKQILVLFLYLYSFNYIHSYYVGQKSFKSGIGETSTIFGLLTKTENQIWKENQKKATIFWEKELFTLTKEEEEEKQTQEQGKD